MAFSNIFQRRPESQAPAATKQTQRKGFSGFEVPVRVGHIAELAKIVPSTR